MDHADHVRLLKKGIQKTGGIWADFGSGHGAFTMALADLLGPESQIHSVDRDPTALTRQRALMASRYPGTNLVIYEADFTEPLDLPQLDGLLIANALHFLPQKDAAVMRLSDYLRPGGRFLVVEYDTDRGNRWVPHPFTYVGWQAIALRCGLIETRLLATVPSSFLGRFFSALSRRPPT